MKNIVVILLIVIHTNIFSQPISNSGSNNLSSKDILNNFNKNKGHFNHLTIPLLNITRNYDPFYDLASIRYIFCFGNITSSAVLLQDCEIDTIVVSKLDSIPYIGTYNSVIHDFWVENCEFILKSFFIDNEIYNFTLRSNKFEDVIFSNKWVKYFDLKKNYFKSFNLNPLDSLVIFTSENNYYHKINLNFSNRKKIESIRFDGDSVMLQLEKEFQNNYFSKLKIKGDSENVRKKTSYRRTKSNDSQRIA